VLTFLHQSRFPLNNKKAKERPTHGALPIEQEVAKENQMLLINMNIVLQYYYLVHMD
jgi:hypothetical protein